MRHTFASQLLQAGEPITYVSAQLGHKDSSITLRVYAHWLPDTTTRKGVDRLDDEWATHPTASQAHPEEGRALPVRAYSSNFLGNSSEPGGNRTHNPQIKSLL